MEGTVFDIAEGSIHDGPGMRITVFLKGCPLRCNWCHSPEGQHPETEMLAPSGVPPYPCGKVWQAEKLADYLKKRLRFLENGGVTFSGGEPLLQSKFLLEVLQFLIGYHTIIDTYGFVSSEEFAAVAQKVSMIFFGLKLLDDESSVRWTGRPCSPVLQNLLRLDRETATPYRLRIPLLAGITAETDYLKKLERFCAQLQRVEGIDFLPSNPEAGAKYAACGRVFAPEYDPSATPALPAWFSPGIPCRLLSPGEIS
ncbi:MAG: radical SAM protein [Lentisphaeria bacterium]|nr:radical SAM protein [Lentisphaeria bacterium]